MEIEIRELNNKDEMLLALPLIGQMYEKINSEKFISALDEMISRNNYKMVAAFCDEKMIGVAGYWISYMFYCGRYLQVCNFVVDKKNRKSGVGGKILNYLEKKARLEKCHIFALDSYTENKRSHPLFFREGFYIRGFHFMKDL